ncbi:hypothetical protein AB0M02_09565 [Actinoplanes sp. NPDC051861]|uniref:hypothetical protein n=1 Tax=Actinoplanes sp. NPDC051861 TaxID=3155170 RepID=UPI003445D6CF
MDLPAELVESLSEPEFWARYTFAHEGEPGSERLGDLDVEEDDEDEDDSSVSVVFAVGGGYALTLEVDTGLDLHELGLVGPGDEEPVELGWDDLAHWHPWALRWSELELICQAVGDHSGAALALLCRFAAVFEDDDVESAVARVEAAFAGLRPAGWDGYWPSGADWLARADFRGQGVHWERDSDGSLTARQEDGQKRDFYSRRLSASFPYAEFGALLATAEATCGGR